MKIPFIFKPSRKKVIILIILTLIGFFIFDSLLKPKSQPLQFASVKKQDTIKSTVSSSGTLTGKKVVNLKFKSSGKLAYMNVKAGDRVTAWQTIAGLDTQDLAINLQQAQNTLRDKQAAAEKTLDDVKDHSKDESFTQKKDRTAAEVARDNAYDAVKEAQRAFQDAYIATPLAGLVTQASPIAGQTVSSADLIAQIVDFSSTFFDTDIDEADIGKISSGQKAQVSLDAYPNRVFEGVVDEILPQTKTTSSGATVVTVRINLGDLAITPINGLTGQGLIILSQTKNVLTIPLEALRGDNTVFVQTDKGVEPKKVTSGIQSDTDVEIKEGLSENDKVLLNPPANDSKLFGGGRSR